MISVESSSIIMSRLISLSLASAKIRKIVVTQKKGTKHEYHPPINLYFYARRGSLKSTVAKMIAKHVGVKVQTNVTKAAMDGTIDKDSKDTVKSVIWDMRGKALILDEFNMGTGPDAKPIKNTLLQITEGGEMAKAVGIKVGKDMELIDGEQYFKVCHNTISIKVLTPVMIFTMIEPDNFGEYNEALFSRFVMLQYNITKSDTRKIIDGQRLLEIEDIEPKSPIVNISTGTYERIVKYVDDIVAGRNDDGLFLRILQDCCKVYAVLGRHSEVDYRLVIELRLSEGRLLKYDVQDDGEVVYNTESLERAAGIIEGLRRLKE